MNDETEVRRNLSIYFGHENRSIVLNMMLGIRKAITSLHPLNETLDVKDSIFKVKCRYELANKRTQHFDKSKSCVFYDYAPMIFERIRKKYGITNEMY